MRKRWDVPGSPWYMVCPCIPGVLYRLGPAAPTVQEAMTKATEAGYRYDPVMGWCCADCIRLVVSDHLDKCLAKVKHIEELKDIEQGAEGAPSGRRQ